LQIYEQPESIISTAPVPGPSHQIAKSGKKRKLNSRPLQSTSHYPTMSAFNGSVNSTPNTENNCLVSSANDPLDFVPISNSSLVVSTNQPSLHDESSPSNTAIDYVDTSILKTEPFIEQQITVSETFLQVDQSYDHFETLIQQEAARDTVHWTEGNDNYKILNLIDHLTFTCAKINYSFLICKIIEKIQKMRGAALPHHADRMS